VKDGQKENIDFDKIEQTRSADQQDYGGLRSGNRMSNPDFKIRVFENNSGYLIERTPVPKNLQDFFRNINVIVEKNTRCQQIEMHEKAETYTTINFVNKELNVNLPDALFAIRVALYVISVLHVPYKNLKSLQLMLAAFQSSGRSYIIIV
jgi:hypothetical protein